MAVNLQNLANLAAQANAEAARLVDATNALLATKFGSFEEPLTVGQKTSIRDKGKVALANLTSLVDQMNTEINSQ